MIADVKVYDELDNIICMNIKQTLVFGGVLLHTSCRAIVIFASDGSFMNL